MMGQCEEAVRDYVALELIDPGNGDLASLYPMAKSCAERMGEASAAEARRNWQVGGSLADYCSERVLTGGRGGGCIVYL